MPGTAPDRAEVLAMLAGIRDGVAAQPVEQLDSLELVWLLHQVEQRYGVSLNLPDEQLEQMSTVDGAVSTLRELLPGLAAGNPGQVDAGHVDAGQLDAGGTDSGGTDARHVDAGRADAALRKP